jgi:DedD protein
MNDILKQRLVGALILVALGVVFWPIIFVEPGDPTSEDRARIPPRPVVDTTPLSSPDMAGLRPSPEIAIQQAQDEPEPTPEPKPEPRPSEKEAQPVVETTVEAKPTPVPVPVESKPEQRTRSEAPVKPALDGDGVPVAWILQVASVSSADRADALRKKLLAMDHKAYVKKIKRGDKSLYRVYIGPKFERARLERIQAGIDSEFGVKSMIARYVP